MKRPRPANDTTERAEQRPTKRAYAKPSLERITVRLDQVMLVCCKDGGCVSPEPAAMSS